MKSKHLTPRQTASVFNCLEANLVQQEREGYVRYINGQTDTTIAERCKVTESQVASMRLREFGKLIGAGNTRSEIMERLEHIESYLESIDMGYVRYGG